jgi:hypothetical protein
MKLGKVAIRENKEALPFAGCLSAAEERWTLILDSSLTF